MSAAQNAVRMRDLSLDRLVAEHRELVASIAYYLVSKMPVHIEVDDLIQAGMIGLLNAAEHFSPDKGTKFETYARIRIRGAILDEVRRTDWRPRSTFRNAKRVDKAVRTIQSDTGRSARPADVAEALEISLDEYHKILESIASAQLLSLEEVVNDPAWAPMLPKSPEAGPFEMLEGDQLRLALIQAISSLPERDQLIICLYYEEELTLAEIGEVLEVSRSRVCQLLGRAVLQIRGDLAVRLKPENQREPWLEDVSSTQTRDRSVQRERRPYRAGGPVASPEVLDSIPSRATASGRWPPVGSLRLGR